MQSTVLLLALSAILVPARAADNGRPGVPIANISMTPAATSVLTLRYTGDLGGVRAEASVSFERMREYVLAAGRIQSSAAKYSFSSEIYGGSGFGTIVDLGAGTRWQIKIQLFNKGFALISNPLGPGSPTTYYFKLVESR
ncbi:MAG: hypothetical protein ACKV2U_23030 [Bryobacteraceae bacterium]